MRRLLDKALQNVRPHERVRFFTFCSVYGLLSFALTLGMAGSEALFIAKLGMETLPMALVAASLLTVGGSVVYTFMVGRWRNDTLFCLLLAALTALLLALSPFLASQHQAIYAVFCIYYLSNAVLTNHFWNWADEYFDATSAKRLFPLFAIASSFGGVIGGIAGEVFNELWGPNSLIVSWAVFTLLTAALLFYTKRLTRNWARLSVSEEDTGAWESFKRAVQYLHTSPLSRWLSISAMAMVLALFISQYIYQTIIAKAFPDAQELATFMNYYLVITNALEMVIEGAVLPPLLVRFGIPRTNLIHPIATFLALLGMLAKPGLYSAIFARVNRELLDNALASPVRTLMYKALPSRLRGHMRAFLEGIVVYAGMALAGLFLQGFQKRFSTNELILVGMLLAGIYLLANIQALRHYLHTMTEDLRSGRIDWSSLGKSFGTFGNDYLCLLWRSMTAGCQAPAPRPVLQLAAVLGECGAVALLTEQLHHPCAQLRQEIAKALSQCREKGEQATQALMTLCADPEASVVCQALAGIRTLFEQQTADRQFRLSQQKAADRQLKLSQEQTEQLSKMLNSPDPQIAASAAILMGEAGQRHLDAMAQANDRETVLAALKATDSQHRQRLLGHADDSDPDIKLWAIHRLAEIGGPI
ncbi:hypothetical protein IJT17_07795, partial [bacterium]|nr:hypothetical protein [bacterium]